MKIVYFANFGNKGSDNTEEHIVFSLQKLGHEVIKVHEKDPDIAAKAEGDLLLFHKGGQWLDFVLKNSALPKVCWYFDKVWNERPYWMKDVLEKSDMVAMTDEAWAKKNPHPKIRILRQGIGDEDVSLGRPRKEWEGVKIAFLGSIYGERGKWVEMMKKRYLGQFRAFSSVFNRDLYDFCATVPIIAAPRYPSGDYYWSSRIYMILGSGGFLIHPRLKGLEKEYRDGTHYAGYSTDEEMHKLINHYLVNDILRLRIKTLGYQKTITKFTYTERVKKLLEYYAQL